MEFFCLLMNFIKKQINTYKLYKLNHMKGGVDGLNRYIANYWNNHGNYKWWKQILLEILEISKINSSLIYNMSQYTKNESRTHRI